MSRETAVGAEICHRKDFYKKVKKIPSSECSCCAKKMNRALKTAIKNIDTEED